MHPKNVVPPDQGAQVLIVVNEMLTQMVRHGLAEIRD
jgi:hypothetical protein